MASKGGMMGGLTTATKSDCKVQEICDKVKPHAEEMTGKNFELFSAVIHATQVVAGTNYFIKVKVGENDYVHLRVYETLPYAGCVVKLSAIQENKTLEDEIVYFE